MSDGRYERELVNEVAPQYGYAAMRAPASGSANTDDLPDVLFGRRNLFVSHTVAIEAKTRSPDNNNGRAYIDYDEMLALERFAVQWGANPYIGYRRKGRTTWYFIPPAEARRTEEDDPRSNFVVGGSEPGRHAVDPRMLSEHKLPHLLACHEQRTAGDGHDYKEVAADG